MTESLSPSVRRLLIDADGGAARETAVLPTESSAAALLRHAAARELRIVQHRMARPADIVIGRRRRGALGGSVRERISRHLGGGVILAEHWGGGQEWRELLAASGFVAATAFPDIGIDGSVRAYGTAGGNPAVLRVGMVGTPADPQSAIVGLGQLAGVPLVPQLLGHGLIGRWRWSVERRMPGSRPGRLDDSFLGQAHRWLRLLAAQTPAPAPAAAWAALHDDAAMLARVAPGVSEPLASLVDEMGKRGTLMPAPAHGDFWSGNLLVGAGRSLTGVVDWDGFRHAGIGGTDLVQLVCADERIKRRQSLGSVACREPWQTAPLRDLLLAPTRPPIRVAAQRRHLRDVGTAWLLTVTAASLRRLPELSSNLRWLDDNVVIPLRRLSR